MLQRTKDAEISSVKPLYQKAEEEGAFMRIDTMNSFHCNFAAFFIHIIEMCFTEHSV